MEITKNMKWIVHCVEQQRIPSAFFPMILVKHQHLTFKSSLK